MKLIYVVSYHADGGQTCMQARKEFDDVLEAGTFHKKHSSRFGHTCHDPSRMTMKLEHDSYVIRNPTRYPFQ